MINNQQQINSSLKQPVWSQNVFILALIAVFVVSPLFNKAYAIAPLSVAVQMVPASFADLVDKVRPSVVSISTTKKSSSFWQEFRRQPGPKDSPFDDFFRKDSPFDDFFRRFFERESFQLNQGKPDKPEHKASGLGSGFLINAEGLIVTNHHVIDGADEIKATLNDGSKYPAKVLGHDAKTDLALLKIEVDKPLPYVSFGDSNKARVGDWVIAVGNPFGFGGTFTVGIISARGRDIQSGPYDDFIQIDASINKGNSGGPLLNMDGEVIGINTAIYSPTGGNVGIGFAVPTSMAVPVIEQLQEHGSVERGWLGVQIQSVNDEIAESLGMSEAKGALVVKVLPETPAEKAGILAGDVIFEVNGKSANSAKELSRMVANTAIGKPAKLSILRHGSLKTVSVVLGRMTNDETVTLGPDGQEESSDILGLKLAEITERTRQQYKLPEDVAGIIIVNIKEESPAADAGLQRGDVIMMVNQKQVSTPDEVISRVEQAIKAERKMVLLLVNRQGSPRFMTVKIK